MSSSVDSPVAVAGKGLLRVVFYSAILFSVFQLVTSAFSPLSSTVVRALHVGFLLLLTFLLHPWQGGQGRTSLATKAIGFAALFMLLGWLSFGMLVVFVAARLLPRRRRKVVAG